MVLVLVSEHECILKAKFYGIYAPTNLYVRLENAITLWFSDGEKIDSLCHSGWRERRGYGGASERMSAVSKNTANGESSHSVK
jgi:hypothetical protein